ncbi:MAG TPA: bifunctional DNA-binding transcriptional regulator/O6-methylguanine-DNA methyltransferase Ada [Alphaproteobacteria bacterium]|jgi:AraC family transcriptional regulator of adaptative response/methylated-DNA-[protein]-cysteine methyltransferase|nr:bifunctional DNA-binding transcriptional regulator/O6-methylguanine-DNA methyltransferase Ada [Alphaproteobacteria bacterium]
MMSVSAMAPAKDAPDFSTDEDRWQAVMRRDRRADGRFYLSVATTGVYCRPSCGARRPNRKNVAFHATTEDARRAGFRACKRCRPDETDHRAAVVAQACRLIEQAETPPSLAELAEAVGMSPFHFHRVFKAATGVTPKAYADAERARRIRAALDGNGTVTEAIYDAGFNSNGRFYAAAPGRLGMTPTRFREGGAGETVRFALGQTSLGAILVAATDKGIVAIQFADDPDALVRGLEDRFPKAKLVGGDKDFETLVAQVVGSVEDPAAGFDLPLDVRGTAFQQRVWQALREIPAGATASYSDIAERVGAPKAVRAVAGACAANDIAVAIPCHRVVRNDGAISGYRWGVERKRALLDREAAA